MAEFVNNDLTDSGRLALAKAASGKKITFTKIVMGDGYMPSGKTPKTMTALVRPKAVLDIVKLKVQDDGTVIAGGIYTNAQETSGWYYRELGLYAEIEDGGSTEEVLYCYGNCGDFAEWIPAIGGNTVLEKVIDILTIIGPATEVHAYINAHGYATIEMLEDVERLTEAAEQKTAAAFQLAEQAMKLVELLAKQFNAHLGEYAEIKTTVNNLFNQLMLEVGDNQFAVTFKNLNNVTLSSGVWNSDSARLEC